MRRRLQGAVVEAMVNTWRELGLASAIGQWCPAWLPLPTAPHIEVYQYANPKTIGAFLKAPYVKLPPEDIALLEADPDKRQRYCELVAHSWVPPLRVLSEVFMTQVRPPPPHRLPEPCKPLRAGCAADTCGSADPSQGVRPDHAV
jgi:hypothetical protein